MALGGAAWRNETRAWRCAMLKTPRPNTDADERQRRTIICRRPVGQRGYGNKGMTPLNRERRRSALGLGGTGHGTARRLPKQS